MENLAGKVADKEIMDELTIAGIEHKYSLEKTKHSEVQSGVYGELNGWTFVRHWYYWVAKGPAIPTSIAEKLHKEYGKVVRVDGDAGAPSPTEHCGTHGVRCYHVDTQLGLMELAKIVKSRNVLKDVFFQ